MEFEGTVYKVLPVVKGTSQRGEWMKQEVVFELPGEFNRKICVGFWGDKAHDAGTLREGDKVAVSIYVETRENNGRWFAAPRGRSMTRKTPAFLRQRSGSCPSDIRSRTGKLVSFLRLRCENRVL